MLSILQTGAIPSSLPRGGSSLISSVTGLASSLRGMDLNAPGRGAANGIAGGPSVDFQKLPETQLLGAPQPAEGGLSAMLRGSSSGGGIGGSLGGSMGGGIGDVVGIAAGPRVGSLGSGGLLGHAQPGAKVQLSASFRDPSSSFIPQSTIIEGANDDSDGDSEGVPSDLESSDDEFLGTARKGGRARRAAATGIGAAGGGGRPPAGPSVVGARRSIGGGTIAEERGEDSSDSDSEDDREGGARLRRGRVDSLPTGSGGRGGAPSAADDHDDMFTTDL